MRSRLVSFGLLVAVAAWMMSCAPEQPGAEAPPQPPEKPPEVYQVKFETSRGDFVIEVHRDWAPRGADHFFDLVKYDFYGGVRFFRVIRNYIVQFGINGDPKIQSLWGTTQIPDDPVVQSNKRGFVSFAKLGPNSRTTQVFINLKDNQSLDDQGFAPFGQVVEGMDVIERLWSSYGEVAPRGTGPDPTKIEQQGNEYLDQRFPRLDYIIHARVVPASAPPSPAGDTFSTN